MFNSRRSKRVKFYTPENHPEAVGYTHGVATSGPLLFISGQTPKRPDGGPIADSPEDQLRQIWTNIKNVLDTAGAGLSNLVHVRVFLADRKYRDAYRHVRTEVLGDLRPGVTVVICGIFDEAWVAEIEAVAELPGA
jgi:2-iminobutanoate/2-iminopropanoate deaminase